MVKIILIILVFVLLLMRCNDEKSVKKPSTHGMKCGAGKCGSSEGTRMPVKGVSSP